MSDLSIDNESEDLFASPGEVQVKNEDMNVDKQSEGADEKTSSEKKGTESSAVPASATLVKSTKREDDADDEDDGEMETEEGDQVEGVDFKIPTRFTKSGRKRATPFPLKLMKVLSTQDYEDIITWMPSGKSFSILKPKAFVSAILPSHFKSAKYSSFTRKLHRWGFMRHYRGDEAGAFFHKDFQKDRLDLVEKMTCHKAEPPKSIPLSSAPQEAEKAASVRPVHTTKLKSSVHQAPVQSKGSAPRQLSCIPPPNPLHANSLNPNSARQMVCPPMVDPKAAAASDLNAAIEMEVSRRLKERINAAAISRQALVMMQQQQHINHASPPMHDPRFLQWGAHGAQSIPGQPGFLAPSQLAMPPQGIPQGTMNSYPKFDPYSRLAYSGDSVPPFQSLPNADIQGAKTA